MPNGSRLLLWLPQHFICTKELVDPRPEVRHETGSTWGGESLAPHPQTPSPERLLPLPTHWASVGLDTKQAGCCLKGFG